MVGDNDFMHHQVERVDPREPGPPGGVTIDTVLEFDDEQWCVVDDGQGLGYSGHVSGDSVFGYALLYRP